MSTVALLPARITQNRHSPLALWHLLSLDAPAVAAVWLMFLARVFGVRMPWTAPASLLLAVWLIYALDRIADASCFGGGMQARHHFHHRHRLLFTVAAVVSLPALLLLVIALPHDLRTAWLMLGVPLAVYAAAVHLMRKPVGKEWLVGIFFATVTAAPVAVGTGGGGAALPLAAGVFGALCWLNCAAIARWEQSNDLDMVTARAASSLQGTLLLLLTLCAVLLAGGVVPPVALSVGLSVLGLLMLEWTGHRMLPVHRRALADATLLTPLLLWRFPHLPL